MKKEEIGNTTVIVSQKITEEERQRRLREIKQSAITLWMAHLRDKEVSSNTKNNPLPSQSELLNKNI